MAANRPFDPGTAVALAARLGSDTLLDWTDMLHQPGSSLAPCEIVSAVGAGGLGEVYKATDTRLDRTVAAKVAKEQFGDRFRNEAVPITCGTTERQLQLGAEVRF